MVLTVQWINCCIQTGTSFGFTKLNMALVMSKSVVCRTGVISHCHCRQSHFIGMQCIHLTPVADTGLISNSTAIADLVPATGLTSDPPLSFTQRLRKYQLLR